MKRILFYLVPVLFCFGIGAMAGWLQSEALVEWYPTLVKSPLTPPAVVFPVAWSILYLCMGISLGAVLAREELETPAGRFSCFKLQEKFSFRFLFFSFASRRVAWYAPGIGVVREEELTKKGKLESSSELIAIRHADADEEPAAGEATAGAK